MSDEEDEYDKEPVHFEVDGHKVMFAPGADCDRCGADSVGVWVPVEDGVPERFDGGIPMCQSCYDNLRTDTLPDALEWLTY